VGNIGKAVVKRARAFDMEILGNDIQEIPPDFVEEFGLKMTSFEELLKTSDFVSINCTLNSTSRGLMNREAFSNMKPGSVLINTARGPIVEEKELVDALVQEKIAGAALDVYEFEPLPQESPLREFENVLLAPHNSNSSPKAWEYVHWNTIKNLLDGLGIPYQITERGELR